MNLVIKSQRWILAAVFAAGAIVFPTATPAPAQEPPEQCADWRTGIDLNSGCSTGCCLTVIPNTQDPVPPVGLCIPMEICAQEMVRDLIKPCAGADPLSLGPNFACKTNCCLTFVPGEAGLCVPADACAGGAPGLPDPGAPGLPDPGELGLPDLGGGGVPDPGELGLPDLGGVPDPGVPELPDPGAPDLPI